MTQRRLRILIAYSTRYPTVRGGIDTMIVSLVDQLRDKHDVTLFAAGEPEETTLSCNTVDGISTYAMHLRLPFYSRFRLRNFIAWLFEFPRSLWRLRRLVRDLSIDVIHLHTLNRYLLVFAALRVIGGPPYLITLHGTETLAFPDSNWAIQKISKTILRHASRINAVSPWLAAQAKAILPISGDVVSISNGVDPTTQANLPRPEIESLLGGPLPDLYFTMLGTLQHYKAHDVAIRAWAILRREIPDAHLFIAGAGPLEKDYRSLIEALGCRDSIHLTGYLPRQVALSLAGGGLGVIFPSRNEGQGYVLLEAGILGIPVICSDIGPFTDLVTDKENALVVPVEDSAALADAARDLTRSPELRSRLGTALQKLVRESYSSQKMAENYMALYEEASGKDA